MAKKPPTLPSLADLEAHMLKSRPEPMHTSPKSECKVCQESCEACYRADHPRGHTCSLAPMSEEEREVIEAALAMDRSGVGLVAILNACCALREARKQA